MIIWGLFILLFLSFGFSFQLFCRHHPDLRPARRTLPIIARSVQAARRLTRSPSSLARSLSSLTLLNPGMVDIDDALRSGILSGTGRSDTCSQVSLGLDHVASSDFDKPAYPTN